MWWSYFWTRFHARGHSNNIWSYWDLTPYVVWMSRELYFMRSRGLVEDNKLVLMLKFKTTIEAEDPRSWGNKLPQLISAYFNCSINLTGLKHNKCVLLSFNPCSFLGRQPGRMNISCLQYQFEAEPLKQLKCAAASAFSIFDLLCKFSKIIYV